MDVVVQRRPTWWFYCRHHTPGSCCCPRVPAALPAWWSCGSAWVSVGRAAGVGSPRCWSCPGESDRRSPGLWPRVGGRWGQSPVLLLQQQLRSWILRGGEQMDVDLTKACFVLLLMFSLLWPHQKPTIWFLCSLGLCRRGSWLKAVERENNYFEKMQKINTLVTMVTAYWIFRCQHSWLFLLYRRAKRSSVVAKQVDFLKWMSLAVLMKFNKPFPSAHGACRPFTWL